MEIKRPNFFLLLLAALLAMSVTPSMAQEKTGSSADVKPSMEQTKSSSFLDKLMLDMNFGAGTKCSDVTPLILNMNFGYRFLPRAYAFVRYDGLFGMGEKHEGVRTYTKSTSLGGGLGYTFSRVDMVDTDLRGSVTSSVGDVDWKHVAYDVTLLFKIGPSRSKFYVGIGYRHVSSRTAGISGYNGVMGTLGFGF